MNKTKLIGISLLLVILVVAGYIFKYRCAYYSCLDFPGKSQWNVREVYSKEKNSWHGLLKHPDYLVRLYEVGDITNTQAQEFTKITQMKINGLFDAARSPYPGEISDTIVCPEKLTPQKEDFTSDKNVQIHFMSSYLNDRLQYGACTESQVSYKVYSGIFYCETGKKWYQVEIITKPDSDDGKFKELYKKVGC